jgi:hypothetical protein
MFHPRILHSFPTASFSSASMVVSAWPLTLETGVMQERIA